MRTFASVDYLVIGHVTQDVGVDGRLSPGGTAAYAALTAAALGDVPGIVTSVGPGAELGPLGGVACASRLSRTSSVYANVYGPAGRVQRLVSAADPIDPASIPAEWYGARVVHLGPVASEIDPAIVEHPALAGTRCLGVTPQGWMRRWDRDGVVTRQPWEHYLSFAGAADAVVFSNEDVESDERVIRELAGAFPITAVTRGREGARLFVRGEPPVDVPVTPREEVDPTGAGDVFSAVFFSLLAREVPPVRAAIAACELASRSVERQGLEGVPRRDEASEAIAELGALVPRDPVAASALAAVPVDRGGRAAVGSRSPNKEFDG
jgi:sugar/nucleoside kinase (ribokinase family)